ncbi:MAG TPA: VOC family protein [Solirubrobacteraceae bacterium]|nr:VOC family protein [Solirubrobacteraceae bacterium]
MTQVPNPALHHVTLKTTRVQEMLDWYGTVVGMTANHHSQFGAWMTNDAANHRVALLAHPALSDDPDKVPHAGIHHLAFEYAGVGELIATYERLRGLGIEPHVCLDHGLTTSLYYLDPDGNSVELQADNFGDWAASSDWMRTAPEFEVNPIGINVDPDRLAAAWRELDDPAELHRRSYAGEFDPGTLPDLRLPDL